VLFGDGAGAAVLIEVDPMNPTSVSSAPTSGRDGEFDRRTSLHPARRQSGTRDGGIDRRSAATSSG
jgi:3-oxoacyl-[acyl-carrier-protein] synthase III